MANSAALKEQYQRLGFRVIEGGKGGKAIVLTTVGIGEIYGVRHLHVLRDVRRHREKIEPNLVQSFSEHCRESKYSDAYGRPATCFELTKIGFNTIAPNYDPTLGFLLALGFDALERDDDAAGETVVVQINRRIRELRSRASGHDELDLPPPAISEECERREEQRDAANREQLRRIGIDGIQGQFDLGPAPGERSLDALMAEADANDRHLETIADAGHSFEPPEIEDEASESWIDQHEGVDYKLIIRPADGRFRPLQLSMMRADDAAGLVLPVELTVMTGAGQPVLLNVDGRVPLAVILRAVGRLDAGEFTPVTIATIREYFEDIDALPWERKAR